MKPMSGMTVAAIAAGILLSACGRSSDPGEPPGPDRVAVGAELYQQNCASCHRPDLSGDPDWKTPNVDGSYPPPPHDSSGHTWHHPDRVLIEIIRDGSDFPQSRMPAFGDRLTEDEIEAILEFFKDNWGPDERAYQQQVTEQDPP
ncbi:MAG: cytochrome c [Acidimicrobiia bacterium]